MAECDLDMVIAEQNMIANHEEIWHQKYERHLRDKNDTIAALVTEWEGLLTQLLPSGEKAIVCLPSGALWSFDAAIKEATDAT